MKTKLAAIAVVALMMMAVAPAVSAQPFNRAKGKYAESRKEYQDSYSSWQSAKDDFNRAMANWRGNKSEMNFSQLVSASKHSADKAAEMMIRNLEMIKSRIVDTVGLSDNEKDQLYAEIDGYIDEIRAKNENIQDAQDRDQIRAAAAELQNYWLQIRVRLMQITGEVMIEYARVIVQRVEAFAARVETRIQQLKENGIDTSSFENLLDGLRQKIEIAEQTIAQAENDISQITDNATFMEIFREAQNGVREAVRYLKDALKDLKDIIQGVRRNGHTITIEGSGTLIAQGNGRVYITGTGTVKVKAPINGNMLVSPNATVTTSGEGTQTNIDNNWMQYHGYDNAVITGTDITVDISGNGIDIVASGTGTVILMGHGTYSTYGENYYVDGAWKDAGVDVTLQTGEAA